MLQGLNTPRAHMLLQSLRMQYCSTAVLRQPVRVHSKQCLHLHGAFSYTHTAAAAGIL